MMKKLADLSTDAYPGETPERQNQIDVQRDYSAMPEQDPVSYTWILTNTDVSVTPGDNVHTETDDWDFPHATGRLELQYNYRAVWQVERTNMAIASVEKRLKKYTKEEGWLWQALLAQDGHPYEGIKVTASMEGVGPHDYPDKEWKLHEHGEEAPWYQNQPDPTSDEKPLGAQICPECGEVLPDFGALLVHQERAHNGVYDPQKQIRPVIDLDQTIPADWNTLPAQDSTIERQASVQNLQIMHHYPASPDTAYLDINGGKATAGQIGLSPTNGGVINVHDGGQIVGSQTYETMPSARTGLDDHGPYFKNHGPDAVMLHEAYVHPDYRYPNSNAFEMIMDELRKMDKPVMTKQFTNPKLRGRFEEFKAALQMNSKPKPIPAPIPFVYEIDKDNILVGHPGERHSDIPGRQTVNVVEGLYMPDGKLEFKTNSTMPYTVRHMIRLWYTLHPELEIKHVWKMVGDKKVKLAAQDIGQTVRSLAFADPAARAAYEALSPYCNMYVVGGAVRDAVRGQIPKDVDLMAQGISGENIMGILSRLPGRVDLTGKDFGVYRFKTPDGSEVEIALPRTEQSSGEGHKDFDVHADPNLTPEQDLARRDFTGNAMAVNMGTGELIDPYKGGEDLNNGVLRVVNDGAFHDDPLRILRAFASVSRHGLSPDPATAKAIEENAHMLSYIPAERIQMELDKIMGGDDPERAIRAMRDLHVLPYVLPEVEATVGFDQKNKHHQKVLDEHLLEVLRRTQEQTKDPDVRMAALLHDIGKPSSYWEDDEGNGHFYKKVHLKPDPITGKMVPTGETSGAQHEEVGAEMSHELLTRLKYPNVRRDRITHLVNHHMFPPFENATGARKFIKKVGPEHAFDLLKIRRADQSGKGTSEWEDKTPVQLQEGLVQQAMNDESATSLKDLAITGNDLLKAGFKGGPQMGYTLNKLLEAVLEHPEMNNPETLMDMAGNIYNNRTAAVEANILDPIKDELDPAVFLNPDSDLPKVKPSHVRWVKQQVYRVLKEEGYPDPKDYLSLILTGSLTSYQWSSESDFDISLWVDVDHFPEWQRADMIAIMTTHLDGTTVPGTTHPLQCYVVPEHVTRDQLYRPGLRSAFDLDRDKWLVPPDKSRVKDINELYPQLISYARIVEDKMRLLLRFNPPAAKIMWDNLHGKRRKDMVAGKGDFAESNIVYKWLANAGLFPQISETTGEYLASNSEEEEPPIWK